MKYKGAAIQYDCHFMDKEKNLADLPSSEKNSLKSGLTPVNLIYLGPTEYTETERESRQKGR